MRATGLEVESQQLASCHTGYL